jgi:hypothetical protein
MKKYYILLLCLPLLFASCSKDDKGGATPVPSSTPQSVYSVIDISNATPDATYYFGAHSSVTNIQVPSGSFSYTSDTWDVNLPIGTTFHSVIYLLLTTSPQVIGCSDIEIRTYHNTNLINTENFQIGYTQITPQAIFCNNLVAQNQFSKQIAIIAD